MQVPPAPRSALIVGMPRSRGVLAATRSLARAGWRVDVGSTDRRGLASASRFASGWRCVPAVEQGPECFIRRIVELTTRCHYDLVFAGNEAELLALSSARHRFRPEFPYAEHPALELALDKERLRGAAQAVGLRVPRLLELEDAESIPGPVVVKARHHAQPQVPGHPARIDTHVVPASQVRRRVGEIEELGGYPVIEEFVRGPLIAYATVLDQRGEAVAEVQQEAWRIWPPLAGASCRARTVPIDRPLSDRIQALLRSFGWYGLAEVQLIRAPDGVPRLIDLNGRFYGSLSLAIAAGADLPAIWAAVAVGAPPDQRCSARPGVRYQWLAADLRRALVERRGGVLTDLAGCLARAPFARQSVWELSDPAPSLVDVASALARRRPP